MKFPFTEQSSIAYSSVTNFGAVFLAFLKIHNKYQSIGNSYRDSMYINFKTIIGEISSSVSSCWIRFFSSLYYFLRYIFFLKLAHFLAFLNLKFNLKCTKHLVILKANITKGRKNCAKEANTEQTATR